MTTPSPPSSLSLPPSDFLRIGGDVKAQLQAIKLARQQAAAASAAATALRSTAQLQPQPQPQPPPDDIQFNFFSHTNEEKGTEYAHHIHAIGLESITGASAVATAGAVPLTTAVAGSVPVPVTSPTHPTPIGFGSDEEFISLTFNDDQPTTTTKSKQTTRGTKRTFTDTVNDRGETAAAGGMTVDDSSTQSSRIQMEGPYRAPWACGAYTHPNFTLRLHEEILDFCTYVSPKPEEQQMRAELITRIEAIAREAFPSAPNLRLRPFGSYATKLYLPISDVDLVLFGVDPHHSTNPSMEKGKTSALGILERTMRSKQNATYLEHISGARIPILKFTDKLTGVKVDICYEIEGGLKAAEFIIGMQHQMPALRPLTLFLKYFLHCRILNDTYKGGIGSFMLQLMLINHLQQLQSIGRLNQPTTNLGMLLMSFLEAYGLSLNYKHVGLHMNASTNSSSSASTNRSSFFNKSSKGWFNINRPYLLSIENPLDMSHDVGSNSYLILRVRKAFQFAYQTLAAHLHYDHTQSTNKQQSKKNRSKLPSSTEPIDPTHPFAGSSQTPQTLLSHIVSVNEEIRPGQEEVDYEEMEEQLNREQQSNQQRSEHVHIIESSDDDQDESSHLPPPAFGDALVLDDDTSNSNATPSHDSDSDSESVSDHNDMTGWEKQFQVDQDEDQDEDGDEDELEDGEIDEGDEDTAAAGDDDHLETDHRARKKSRTTYSQSTTVMTDSIHMNDDFIPLTGSSHSSGPSHSHSNKKKGKGYQFDHTPHPSNRPIKTGQAKSKQKALLRGHKTGGLTPNNQLYESQRAKRRKSQAKKNHKRIKK